MTWNIIVHFFPFHFPFNIYNLLILFEILAKIKHFLNKITVNMIFEQHRLELCTVSYMQVFFPILQFYIPKQICEYH